LPLNLRAIVDALTAVTPGPETGPITDPLELILWENVGYLIEDERRAELFSELKARVGIEAHAIAAADDRVLYGVAERGGMRPADRVERWREIARIVLAEAGGDLSGRLRDLPVAKARSLLKRFPSIGDPGADRILLFSGLDVRPSVESNGLRVLVRLGFVEERDNYGAMYREAVAALADAGAGERAWLMDAWRVLREHGKRLCRRSAPDCLACAVDDVCGHVVMRKP